MTTQKQIDDVKAAYAALGTTINVLTPCPITPPIDPTDPPPVTTGNAVLIGSHILNRPYRIGPADRVSRQAITDWVAKVPAWTMFANADKQFAPSCNGVEPAPASWVRAHVYGNFQGLYKAAPRIMPDGRIQPLGSKAGGDDLVLNQIPYVKSYPLKGGARGVHCTTPFTAWRSHTRRLDDGSFSTNPNTPYWVGIDIINNVWYRHAGTVTLACTLTTAKGCLDMCTNPVPGQRTTFYAADTLGNQIIKVERGGTTFTESKVCDITKPTSVIVLPNGRMFVAAQDAVWSIANGTATKLIDIPFAFYLDRLSDGKIAVGTLAPAVHVVDPATLAQTKYAVPAGLQSWVAVSVDRNGTCGKVDSIYVVGSHFGSGNNDAYVIKNGTITSVWKSVFVNGSGQTTVGSIVWAVDLTGHYNWTFVPHEDDGMFLIEGESDGQPSIVMVRHSGLAVEDAYDHAAFTAGRAVIQTGCGQGTPYGSVPSFTCIMADQGWSGIGVTADTIAELPFDQQVAFIQGGMIGSFPRPYIKGRDLYNVLYMLNRSSVRFLREGNTHMANLKAYCTPLFGQELPPVPQHVPEANVSTDTFVDVLPAGPTTLQAKFVDNAGNAKVPNAALLMDFYVDEGLPEQKVLARAVPSPWVVPLPTLPSGEHSLRALPTSQPGPSYYVARATVLVVA